MVFNFAIGWFFPNLVILVYSYARGTLVYVLMQGCIIFHTSNSKVQRVQAKNLRGSPLADFEMFGAPPLRSAPNQSSSARARHVQTAASQRAARAAVSAIVAHLQGEKLWSERLLDTDSHMSTKSPHNPRSRPRRPVTRTAPVGAIQYQAAARSGGGVVLPGVGCSVSP